MLMLGEVYTSLVTDSTAVTDDTAASILPTVVGERARQSASRYPMPCRWSSWRRSQQLDGPLRLVVISAGRTRLLPLVTPRAQRPV